MRSVEDRFFLFLVFAISLAFGWILLPFYGAVLWGIVLAVVFAPLCRRLSHAMGEKRGLAAFTTVAIINLFVMLYLLFFLLRDEGGLSKHFRDAIPLRPERRDALIGKFTVVIRATLKGDLLVAALQGTLGGLMFWFLGISAPLLWGVLMAFLSLLPAIGAALVWIPAAIYLLATGAVWQGILLIAYGSLVIGLVDNFLRPMLVGKDTKMPDYLVLVSTLGGIEAFGLNGFVIGPVIAAIFVSVWDIFTASRHGNERTSPGP